MLNVDGLISEMLLEFHRSRINIHPGSKTMYHDKKCTFYWRHTRHQVSEFISRCLTYIG